MIKRSVLLFLLTLIAIWLPAQNTLVRNSDDEIFRTGLELLENEKYGAAREFFQRYIDLGKKDLRSVDAEYYVAYCAMNLFNSDTEDLFQSFINRNPEHSKASIAYYDLGSFYYRNDKFPKAIEYFEKTDDAKLTADQRTEKNFKLGYSYFNQKEFEKGGEYFNKVKTYESKYTYAANYYAGYIEFRNGKYEEALVDLRKAEQNDSYKNLVPPIIANIYYWQGNYDELISYSEKILGSLDKNIQGKDDIFLLTADAYYKKENYKKAAEYFQKLLSENKSKVTPEIKYRLGYSLYKSRDIDGAIAQFQDLAGNQDSIQQASAYYLGLSYLNKGKKDFAVNAFDLARKTAFSKSIQEESLFEYGKINYDLQRYHDAISAFKLFAKEFPKSIHHGEVQEMMSESFLRTSNYSEAISYIESLKIRSLRINSAYQKVTYYSGVQLFNNGDFEGAIKMFNKSIEFPFEKDVYLASHFWKGEAYSVLKDYNNALEAYSTVFQKSDENNEYHLKSRYGVGYIYFNTKEYDKAFNHFKKYTDHLKHSDNRQFYDDALLRLADLYFYNKKYDQAIDSYNEAIAGKINDVDYAYFQRGVVYGIQKKIAESEKSYDVVLKNYPQSVYYDDALFEKAQQNFREGNYEKATTLYTELLNIKPGSSFIPFALLGRAGVYSNLGKNAEGIADYEAILTDYVTHPVADDALLGLQDLYNKEGRGDEFAKWEQQIEKVNPKNELLATTKFNNGMNLYNAEKYKQSIDAFNLFLTNYPENSNVAEARYFLANSYLSTGDTLNAENNYKSVVESHQLTYALRGVQKLADIKFEQKKYDEAKFYYQTLLTNAKNKVEKTDAFQGLMMSFYNTGNYDSTIYYGAEIKKAGNATPDAESISLLYIGKSYYAKKDFSKAIDYFLNTINLAKDENGAEAQYLIAEIQYGQKKYRQSLETLEQLNKTYSKFGHWIEKSFLLIVDNYIALKEVFMAKSILNSIIQDPTSNEVLEQAKKKLADLERKEKGSNE